jgi:hypothetical protein
MAGKRSAKHLVDHWWGQVEKKELEKRRFPDHWSQKKQVSLDKAKGFFNKYRNQLSARAARKDNLAAGRTERRVAARQRANAKRREQGSSIAAQSNRANIRVSALSSIPVERRTEYQKTALKKAITRNQALALKLARLNETKGRRAERAQRRPCNKWDSYWRNGKKWFPHDDNGKKICVGDQGPPGTKWGCKEMGFIPITKRVNRKKAARRN